MQREGWRFPPERREVLNDPERRNSLPPEPLLAAAELRKGDSVVDLGAGTGFWTEILSPAVGNEGKVYAVDVEPVMLEDLREKVRRQGLTNVEVVQSDELAVPLPDGIADLVLMGFVLHEPSDPLALLSEIVRLLKPGGRVLVLDWQKWPTEQGPPVEHRISQEEAEALLGAAGLTPQRLESSNPDVYSVLASEFRAGDPEMTVPTV